MTRWVALALRFVAVWCGWQAFRAIMDFYSALQLLHRTASTLPLVHPWASEAIDHLSKKYTHTPGQVSTDIYWQIGSSVLIYLVWSWLLWSQCLRLASMFTYNLDPELKG